MAFGGVPIGVPRPPMLAAIGIAIARLTRPPPSAGSVRSTGARKASIIAAVAVLLMNIDITLISVRKPRSTHFGFVPKGLSITRASTTSRPTLLAQIANTKPPKNSMMIGSAKAAISSLKLTSVPMSALVRPLLETASSRNTMVVTEVAQAGMISNIHIRAAYAKIAMVRC